MMFSTTLTVTAGQLATDPNEAELDIDRGIIHQVDVGFLDGPENEVHVALRSAGIHQIAPTTSGSIVGNKQVVSCYPRYPVEEPPYRVVLQGWAPDAAYDHEVTVRVHVLPREAIEGTGEQLGLLRRVSRAIFGGP